MFQGFSQETVDFMWGIRFNNQREWFLAHKQEYLDHLYRPMTELCDQVYAAVTDTFPHHGLVRKVSRIYRDARRLHGRGPYKDHLWCSIQRPAPQFSAAPVLWFELTPEEWSCGMGYYAPKAATMAKHRARIQRDPAPLLALERLLAGQDTFVLEGQEYARKKPCPVPELAAWYNRRSLHLIHQEPLNEAIYSPALADFVAEGFRFLMPFHDYFFALDGDPDPGAI